MKSSSFIRSICFSTALASLCVSTPLKAQDADLLDKAEALVHQALNPGGDAPSAEQRTTLLTQALQMTKDAPERRLRRHRKAAILDIKAALDVLKAGDPDNKATEYIREADSELRSAMALAD